MSHFIVEGKSPLKGSIAVTGNKNEALPLIAAAMLSDAPITLHNLPDIGDVRSMLAIAQDLGALVSDLIDGTVTIEAKNIAESTLSCELSSRIRGSILFASALLVRTGKACIPQPGGDTIGRRRIDTHLLVLQTMGAHQHLETTRDEDSEYRVHVFEAPKGLCGTEIYLDEASVTATENALIAAAGAQGVTTIINAACEPHVQGLCRFLCAIGARIEGIGSNILTITGTSAFHAADHTIGSDYIEVGSFIGLAAATGSEITITEVDCAPLRMIRYQFERLGVSIECNEASRSILIPGNQQLIIKKDLGGAITKIEDSPWPAFPADLTSIMVVTATQCAGTVLIHEKMFESRLFFVDRLISMGAQIVLCDPHRAVVVGPSRLYGAAIASPDIRAGMALLIAALAAEGRSTIHNIEQIDRGYQNIDGRLAALGARIERVVDRRIRY